MVFNDLLLMIYLAELVAGYVMLYIAILMYKRSKDDDNHKNNRP